MLLKSCSIDQYHPISPRYLPQIPDICKGIWVHTQQWEITTASLACRVHAETHGSNWLPFMESMEKWGIRWSSTKSEAVHYLVICVYTRVSMVTHNHPDTRSRWRGHQATRYPVLIYRIVSRPHVQARQPQMRSKEEEPGVNDKEKKQNCCHFISTLKCIKQKLWNARRGCSQKGFSTACFSCWMRVMNGSVQLGELCLTWKQHGNSAKPMQPGSAPSSRSYLINLVYFLEKQTRGNQAEREKETCKQSWSVKKIKMLTQRYDTTVQHLVTCS